MLATVILDKLLFFFKNSLSKGICIMIFMPIISSLFKHLYSACFKWGWHSNYHKTINMTTEFTQPTLPPTGATKQENK